MISNSKAGKRKHVELLWLSDWKWRRRRKKIHLTVGIDIISKTTTTITTTLWPWAWKSKWTISLELFSQAGGAAFHHDLPSLTQVVSFPLGIEVSQRNTAVFWPHITVDCLGHGWLMVVNEHALLTSTHAHGYCLVNATKPLSVHSWFTLLKGQKSKSWCYEMLLALSFDA